jgi:hypothetical protein
MTPSCFNRQVRSSDQGRYECQVSTLPVTSYFVTLTVVGKSSLYWGMSSLYKILVRGHIHGQEMIDMK